MNRVRLEMPSSSSKGIWSNLSSEVQVSFIHEQINGTSSWVHSEFSGSNDIRNCSYMFSGKDKSCLLRMNEKKDCTNSFE